MPFEFLRAFDRIQAITRPVTDIRAGTDIGIDRLIAASAESGLPVDVRFGMIVDSHFDPMEYATRLSTPFHWVLMGSTVG